jgi:hypothetical protein
MLEGSPFPLAHLCSLGTPLRRVQRLGLLGPGLLVGHAPVDALQAWPAVTPTHVFPTPPTLERAGVQVDMMCWPLRPRRLLGLLTSALRLGRGDDNDLTVVHHSVSRRHARILTQGRRVTLVDLESAQGTRVNGIALPPREGCLLEEGDQVGFGAVTLRYWRAVTLVDLVLEDRVDRSL